MIEVRPFDSLGAFRNEWLSARHHFSFGGYRDPSRSGVGALLVWNDDEIAPGAGFDAHPHADMEIITYVRQGAITHRDSLGNEGRTEAGDVQVMHAGTGIFHAELNREDGPTRIFQIWLLPNRLGVDPGWEARAFPRDGNGLHLLASGTDPSAIKLYADGEVRAGLLRKGTTVTHVLPAGRAAYLVPATGAVTVNGNTAGTRDGVVIVGEPRVEITAAEDAEIVLVEAAA